MPLENSIGDWLFVAMQGEVVPPREMLEMDQRNGVDGTEFTLIGKKGEPFQLFTQVDAENYDAAVTNFQFGYLPLIEAEPQTLIHNGVNHDGNGFKVKVLGVTCVKMKAITSAVGGLYPPSNAWLEAVWDLIAVATH